MSQINWEKDAQVGFTGRNGVGFCCGVNVTLLNYSESCVSRVMLAPITSQGKLGRCDIDIPIKDVPALIKLLKAAVKEAKS